MWNHFMDCKKLSLGMSENFLEGNMFNQNFGSHKEKCYALCSTVGLMEDCNYPLLHLLIYPTSLWKRESCSCLCFLYIMLYNDISTPECPLLYAEAYNTKSSHKGLWCVVHNMSRNTMPLFWKLGKIFLHCQNFFWCIDMNCDLSSNIDWLFFNHKIYID